MKRFTVQLEDNEFEKLEKAAMEDMAKNAAFARKCIVRHLEDGGSTQENAIVNAIGDEVWARIKRLCEAEGKTPSVLIDDCLDMMESLIATAGEEP